jgi:hypothetical protein
LTKLTTFWEKIGQYSPNLLCVYLQNNWSLAYLSKNTGCWSFGVLLKSCQFHIFLNAQIGSNLKLWMLQHFWVNKSLKIKVHMSRLSSLDYTEYILLLFWHQIFHLFSGLRVYFVKKPQYRLIPVLTFLKYRYYTGRGIEKSIPNWKHYLPVTTNPDFWLISSELHS